MQKVLFYLYALSILLSFAPALAMTGVLTLAFFVVGQHLAADTMLILFVVGLVSRATNGFGL